MPRPLAVFMSGAPGSGKSYLARQLAPAIGLYHFERDAMKHGIEYTAGERGDRSKTIVPVYFQAIEQLLRLGISLVTDGALYADKAPEQLAPIAAVADVVVVHCQSTLAEKRFLERERLEHRFSPASEKAYREHLDWVISMTGPVLDLPYPTLEVQTDDGFDPGLDQICSWINRKHGAKLKKPDFNLERRKVS